MLAPLAVLSVLLTSQSVGDGWAPFWSRTPSSGTATVDRQVEHNGRPTVRVMHDGNQDWSLNRDADFAVNEGDIVEAKVWIKADGPGTTTLGFTTYRPNGEVVDWSFGAKTIGKTDWRLLQTKVLVPAGVSKLLPRVIGNGPNRLWLEGFRSGKSGSLGDLRGKNLPSSLQLRNKTIRVDFNPKDATFSVTDLRSQKQWKQIPGSPLAVVSARTEGGIRAKCLVATDLNEAELQIDLDGDKPEVQVTLASTGEMSSDLVYPSPFETKPGMDLVFPMNEGVSYPVAETDLPQQWLPTYSGHGLCMAFFCLVDGPQTAMTLIETPDDAAGDFVRGESTLIGRLRWVSQKGQYGYPRKARLAFFNKGGYVAAAKRYREHAKETGLFVTLKQKALKTRYIDRLVGSPNVWVFGSNPAQMARKMKDAGFERMLWSGSGGPEDIRAINEMGFLTSEYDIYQDLMDPAQFGNLQYTHPQWTTEGWPKDIMIRADGDWEKGWEIESKAGGMIPCGVLCDSKAIPYAEKRINAVLKEKPFGARFIDTTTASPWRECYSPDHPMTRTDSKRHKMELLKFISSRYGLVTGSETGHDAAVPYVSYFEGMLSLGPFRVPDAGRHMGQTVDPAPEVITKFQLGPKYRVPLWELVYHDCLCSHWYWGDYQNKVPSVWRQRDLFNILYGTAPMFLFTADRWDTLRDRILQSYRDVVPFVRGVGYAEMVDHRYLTPDRSVQQTIFSNGAKATVNFGEKPFRLGGSKVIDPLGFVVEGVPKPE